MSAQDEHLRHAGWEEEDHRAVQVEMVQDDQEVILQALAESTFAATMSYNNMHPIDEFRERVDNEHHEYEDLQQETGVIRYGGIVVCSLWFWRLIRS